MTAFAFYEPDKAIFNPAASTVINNVLPKADGYGPMPQLVEYSEALASQCYGFTYVRSSTGSYSVLAGTQTRLYKLDPSTLAWTDVSGGSAPYSVPDSDRWSFARFGAKLYAATIGSPMQVYDVDSPLTWSDVSGAPQCKYITVGGDFLIGAHLNSTRPQRVQWSGVNDPTFWTSGDRGSDYQDLPDGEDITGIFGNPEGAIIFQRKMIRQMSFDPASGLVFRFNVVNPSRGSIAPLSIVQIGPTDFVYLCEDGFFRGIEGTPIGAERVDRTFLADINHEDIQIVRGVADPFEKIVWWQYPDSLGAYKLLGYNWQLDRWIPADNDVSELGASVSLGWTLDQMDSLGTLSDITIPLDSRYWLGGTPLFGAFTTDNRLAFFSGNPREATIETYDEQPIPGSRAFVSPKGIEVLTDASTFSLEVATSDFAGQTRTWGSSLSPSTVTGRVPCRRSGLLFRSRLTIPEDTTWNHALGLTYNAIPEGQR